MSSSNPFARRSTLPYELPDFSVIRDEHYLPAFYEAVAEHNAEIEAILESGEPTFENTLVALELSGQYLQRTLAVFYNKSSADTNETIDAIEAEIAPKLSAHIDGIRLNPALFERINALFEQRSTLNLDAESLWLVERYHREYTLAGAALSEGDRQELKAINEELSTLETLFAKHGLAESNDLGVVVETVEELAGLSDGEIAAAAAAAADRGLEGKYLITMVNFTGHPWLASLTNRSLRKRIMDNSLAKGARGNESDVREIVVQMATLRAKRAKLLGFATHAAAVTEDETAGTPENVHKMLRQIAPAAVRNARAEAALLQEAIYAEGQDFTLEAHDWELYADRVRLSKYAVDTAAMKPYFELERTLFDGVFFAASKLFGITFTERPDLQAYHPEARVFEVKNTDGSPVGLYIGDFFTRDSKRGGAWMNSLVDQNHLMKQLPVVVNNLNIPKPSAGSPALLTFDEVSTLFHEFGHALHGLFSNVTYPHFSGTSVNRDFVEFPSQVNEMWMLWPEVVANYAKHFETGEPLPQEWIDNLKAAEVFNQGHATTSYLAAAILDLAWHELSIDDQSNFPTAETVLDFEAKAIADYGLDYAPVPTRYRTSYFAHIFAGGYSAGYYGYIWSEILDADTVEWFKQNGGLRLENGMRFRNLLLSRGGSTEAMQLFRDFRGQTATIEPLLRRRGLL
ncbi:MAG: M3 family metallopeptidase [Micrococcales bacterium]